MSQVDDRVMVDYLSYFQYGPPIARNGALDPVTGNEDCQCSYCQNKDGLLAKYRTQFDSDEMQKIWVEEQYLLCPPRVLGYILKAKQWAQLQVSSIEDIPVSDPSSAWHTRLQLGEPETKNLLFNLVQSHISRSSQQANHKRDPLEVDDIVPRKGKGLVILLYGMP